MTIDFHLLDQAFAGLPVFGAGEVWLVGAGPGDPGLLTLAAVSALNQADVIVFDALVDDRVLALAPVATRRIFAGKRGGKPSTRQDDITTLLIERAQAGDRVLRLKGGDPFIFARGGEECVGLARAGVPFRLIAGVTAGLAGMSAASIPTTMRGINQGVFLATGHGAGLSDDMDGIDWQLVARLGQPIVLYMAMRRLPVIRRELLAGGMAPNMPAAVIVSATLPDQYVLISQVDQLVEDVAAAALEPPAIVVIGEVVAQRESLRSTLDVVLPEVAE